MFFNWRGIAVVLGVIAVVIGLCALDLSCGSKLSEDPNFARIKGEIQAGKREMRIQQADELARVALDMRVLAKRYVEQGEMKKARHAMSAAQELDRRIKELRGENGTGK